MLRGVINLLDELKPGILETLIDREDWPQNNRFTRTLDNLNAGVKIRDDIFLKSRGLSSSAVIRLIKRLFDAFNVPKSRFSVLISRDA